VVTWHSTDREWSLRILAEYREMPGLRLTLRQAARLWAMDAVHCQAILDALVASGSLRRGLTGEYCLPCDEEAGVPPRARRHVAVA
jgi:phosphoribosyl-dephospho-CoA transferase